MPTRAEFSERRNLAKTEVVRRLWVGETLTGVCGDPHMPNRTTVVRWARRDETFADALAQAHRRSAWTRHEGFDEVRARIVQARFAAGETLFSICRDPAMPSCKQLAYWRATQGEFGGAIFRLIRDKKAARSSASPHNAPRDWTEVVGDRILLHVGRGHSVRRLRRLDPSLPGPDTIARWRLQNPEFAWELKVNMAVGRQRRVVPTRMAAVLDTLRRGSSRAARSRAWRARGACPAGPPSTAGRAAAPTSPARSHRPATGARTGTPTRCRSSPRKRRSWT